MAEQSMTEVFVYETRQFLEQLEQLALESEQSGLFTDEQVNEIFRLMHTIKGSAAMMMLNEVSAMAHSVEDIFFYIREKKPQVIDVSTITDLVLASEDFMRTEIDKLEGGETPDGDSSDMREQTKMFLRMFKEANGDDPDVDLRRVQSGGSAASTAAPAAAAAPAPQQFYIAPAKKEEEPKTAAGQAHVFAAVLHFQDGCEMEEVRSYSVLNSLQEAVLEIHYQPEKLLEDPASVDVIRKEGFKMWFTAEKNIQEVNELLSHTSFVDKLDLRELVSTAECEFWPTPAETAKTAATTSNEPIKPVVGPTQRRQVEHTDSQMISVRVDKLDRLMDLVGELVIAEAMVTQNPDLRGLELDNFQKAARQLHKINGELQDSVMAIRMVPLEGTFRKMNRIVRDMTKKLGKKAKLVLVGEETEVDKNVIEHIGDPLMHIIRNSVDHGIEMPEVRKAVGKPEQGTVTLVAENAGSEVVLRIIDDGGGLDRDKIFKRAKEHNLLTKPESEYTDKEIYSFIFAPGFSTNDSVTEYSGRGVGMDVVLSNIKALAGKVTVDSVPGQGSTTTIRIPLTLAIIDGMSLAVGHSVYTLPIQSIRQSFRPGEADIVRDPDGSEMIMVRGECFPIVRLHELYGVKNAETDLTQGILVLLENGNQVMAIFADKLLGVQEIVVKPVPKYIKQVSNTCGISGCTLLGDGSISLILDAQGLGSAVFAE